MKPFLITLWCIGAFLWLLREIALRVAASDARDAEVDC